jgi:hypothetical protein
MGCILFQVREIRGDNIDAQEFVVRERHTGIHDDDVIAVANGHRVHTELAQAAQGNNLQLLIGQVSSVTTLIAHNAAGRKLSSFSRV